MVSINVPISDDLRAKAEELARAEGVSLEEFVRNCVSARLSALAEDPLLADKAVFDGAAPSDLSERHDDYLYGEQE